MTLMLRCWLAVFFVSSVACAAPTELIQFPRLGEVTVYRPAGEPREVVLFLSGDGGWNLGVVDMAEHLTEKSALVAGIDIRHFLASLESSAERCVSPDGDLENLSHYLQAKEGIKHYIEPTVVGYSSGATLAYALLAQAPAGLFKGGLSIGFCPDLDLRKPLCKGSGVAFARRKNKQGRLQGVDFLPASKLSGRWIALQGEVDQVCAPAATAAYLKKVPGAEIVTLPKVGHGYSVENNWRPQFEAAFDRIAGSQESVSAPALSTSVADLPLHEIAAAPGTSSPRMAVFLSGDGGWATLDREVSAALAAQGIPVVGWDSLRYFWTARTPDGAAADLERVLRHYMQVWNKQRVVLVGYSQGADTMPFMLNRLPEKTRAAVDLTSLLGLSDSAYFEFHVSHWLGNPSGGLPVAPELAQLSPGPLVCLYGSDEKDSFCRSPTLPRSKVIELPGGHHYSGGYAAVAAKIIERLPRL
jgi:type IV secretory pathway VirJ component